MPCGSESPFGFAIVRVTVPAFELSLLFENLRPLDSLAASLSCSPLPDAAAGVDVDAGVEVALEDVEDENDEFDEEEPQAASPRHAAITVARAQARRGERRSISIKTPRARNHSRQV